MKRSIRIDFHAHILPGLDHGCEDVGVACRQLELAAQQKIDVVVATSHFYPHLHTVESYLRKRTEAMQALKMQWKVYQSMVPSSKAERQSAPKVLAGAEVLACAGIERMEGLQRLCIEGTRVLLLELPFAKQQEAALIASVCRIQQECGIQVVLAHAERYSYRTVMELVEAGILVQLNTASICSLRKNRLCRQYRKAGCVAALGSDIHGIDKKYRSFAKALKRLGGAAEEIMKRTEQLLLQNGGRDEEGKCDCTGI
ncbi:MAG: hypothetical protein IJY09_02295 [Lachnospiraceae bacterium]|nr:hypothetical protein [Lachnospiraceae bacterium]